MICQQVEAIKVYHLVSLNSALFKIISLTTVLLLSKAVQMSLAMLLQNQTRSYVPPSWHLPVLKLLMCLCLPPDSRLSKIEMFTQTLASFLAKKRVCWTELAKYINHTLVCEFISQTKKTLLSLKIQNIFNLSSYSFWEISIWKQS